MKSRTWYLLSLLLLLAAAGFWRLGEQRLAPPAAPPADATTPTTPAPISPPVAQPQRPPPLLSKPIAPGRKTGSAPLVQYRDEKFPYRLKNTTHTLGELSRSETAVLLDNAFIETTDPARLEIPAHLRSDGPPGSYVVQARGAIDGLFREQIARVSAEIVSYIPNNAYLVRGSEGAMRRLGTYSRVQSVLPYEPYYKLEKSLLPLAVEQQALGEYDFLNVVLFPGSHEAAVREIEALGAKLVPGMTERVPFGTKITVRPTADNWVAIARVAGVQNISQYRQRVLMNDLTRERMGVNVPALSANRFLNLTGNGVMVAVVDSGVAAGHPGLSGRVTVTLPPYIATNAPNSITDDTSGHGTHVAGIIAGTGAGSPAGNNAIGSVNGVNFAGMAPAALIYPMGISSNGAAVAVTDSMLQTAVANTNVAISANAWGYGLAAYDVAAASYDAAARDSDPLRTNSQPMLYVFAAGNQGAGNDYGLSGSPDSISSPATGKNVVTVGSVESARGLPFPYTLETDEPSFVSGFSSRGNVGMGTESPTGRFKPDVVAPGAGIVSARAATTTNTLMATVGGVATNLDTALLPNYRYETGTSMSAGAVAGVLALMQEFLTTKAIPSSPSLLKALLINGARTVDAIYNISPTNQLNYQGWGFVNITNSITTLLSSTSTMLAGGAAGPIRFAAENPTNVLATGQSHNWDLTMNASAVGKPLRLTLVWTDPPGNPAASYKLVNDLDLVVSEIAGGVTNAVYWGNNFSPRSDFTQPTPALGPAANDIVNNVENVFLQSPVAGVTYRVTVFGRKVNVNAITSNTNNVVQDYSLVVSTADLSIANPFTLSAMTQTNNRVVPVALNNAVPLLSERVGANSQFVSVNTTNGTTNQWNFYVFTNQTSFVTNGVGVTTNLAGSNVAFIVFRPPNLSKARNQGQADLDLYVSLNPALTNLDPAVVSAGTTFKSVSRGGSEAFYLTNATAGLVYYIGVKSEDQQGGQYGFVTFSSDTPFAQQASSNAPVTVTFFPLPMDIPDGTPDDPGGITLFGICPISKTIQRMVITNTISHELPGDLLTALTHDATTVVLHNHDEALLPLYDDYTNSASGPGSLVDFLGQDGIGLWQLTVQDSSFGHVGTVSNIFVALYPMTNSLTNAISNLQPNQIYSTFVDVPNNATNLIINLDFLGGAGEVEILVRYRAPATTNLYDYRFFATNPPTALFTTNIDPSSVPPLLPGRYFVSIRNKGTTTIGSAQLSFILETSAFSSLLSGNNDISQGGGIGFPLIDDAITNFYITNFTSSFVYDLNVGVNIIHPRISDLVLTLVSPRGTRILLAENRGYLTNDMVANFTENTNFLAVPIKFAPTPFLDVISPPLALATNIQVGAGSDETLAKVAVLNQALYFSGTGTNAGSSSTWDGYGGFYALPITNGQAAAWRTNWPGSSPPARTGPTYFHGVAASSEGVYFAGHTDDYFPAVPPSAGGFAPDVYDFDTGCTNGIVHISYNMFTVPDQMTVYFQGLLLTNTGYVSNGPPGGPYAFSNLFLTYSGTNSFIRVIMNEFTNSSPGTLWRYTISNTAPCSGSVPTTKGVVVKYNPGGPVPGGNAGDGAIWLSRAFTNNVFGYNGNDRLQAIVVNPEGSIASPTNFLYVTGSAEVVAGLEGFVVAKVRTNASGFWIASPPFTAASGPSRGMAITVANNGNDVIAAGYTNYSGSNESPYLVSCKTNGTITFANYSSTAAGLPYPVWAAGTGYAVAANVQYLGLGYTAIAANTNQVPPFSPLYWTALPPPAPGFYPGRYLGVTYLGSNIFAVGTTDAITNTGDWLIEKWDFAGNLIQRAVLTNASYTASSGNILYAATGLGSGCGSRIYAVGVGTNTVSSTSQGVLLEIDPSTLTIASIVSNDFAGLPLSATIATGIITDGSDLYVTGQTRTALGDRDTYIVRYKVKNYYLPEEPLTQLLGEPSLGVWTLEVSDTRQGPYNGAGALLPASLVCWDINFTYGPTNSTIVTGVLPGQSVGRVLFGGQSQAFQINSPPGAKIATNAFTASGPVNVRFSPSGPPTPGSRLAIAGSTNGALVLGGNSSYDFPTASTYYLSFENPNPNAAVTLNFRVDFDNTVPGVTNTPPPTPDINFTAQPVSQTVPGGATAALLVGVSGTGPFQYQWRFNGVPIPGETNGSVTLAGVGLAQSGGYDVVVSNPTGSVPSSLAILTVNVAPTITVQPAGATVGIGGNVVLSVITTGTPVIKYQWRKNGVDLVSQAGPNLTLTGVQPGDAGDYSVLVSNPAGFTTSLTAALTVVVPPRLTTQPVSRTVTIGDPVSFSVAATGAGTLHYQWSINGTNIAGATNDTLTLARLRIDQSGNYRVIVTDALASTMSDVAALTVLPAAAPIIVTQPRSQPVSLGGSGSLFVSAIGVAPLRYQWLRDNGPIPNATNATYTTPTLDTLGSATYSVVVTNGLGRAASDGAVVTVVGVPVIDTPLQAQTVPVGGTLRLSVGASGVSLSYIWIFDGQFVADATNATLVVTNVQLTDAGSYSVIVGNAAGLATNSDAVVTVDPLPLILSQPINQSVILGNPVVISVALLGQPPFSYQWRRNNVDMIGETNVTFSRVAAGAASGGDYSVRVRNSYGVVMSSNATLTVTGPPLTVQRTSGQLSLSIPPAGSGFVLEYTDGFGPGHVWTPVTVPNGGAGGEVTVPIDLPSGARIYRLRLP